MSVKKQDERGLGVRINRGLCPGLPSQRSAGHVYKLFELRSQEETQSNVGATLMQSRQGCKLTPRTRCVFVSMMDCGSCGCLKRSDDRIVNLSAPSPGDDLRPKSAIRLRGQTVRSDCFWEIGCDFSAVTIRMRLRCILR